MDLLPVLISMRTSFILLALLIVASLPNPASAARLSTDDQARAACVSEAATRFRVPELALWVLLDVEAGKVGEVSGNTNGSYDIGPMQINSWWLGRLDSRGITEDMVLNNLCMNIAVGAWILAQELDRHKDLVTAMAHYHSPTPHLQKRYLGLVVGAIDRRLSALQREGALASN